MHVDIMEPSQLPNLAAYARALPIRTWIAALLFLGLGAAYMQRTVPSIVIQPLGDEFGLSTSERGVGLSAFFAGYLLLQPFGGAWAQSIGGLRVLGWAVALSSVLTAITPMFAGKLWSLIAIRMATGLAQAPIYSSVHAICGLWAPAEERSRMVSIAWSGALVGTIIVFPVAGAMASWPVDAAESFGAGTYAGWAAAVWSMLSGWRAVFRLFGGVGIAWCALWFAGASSSPETHRFITASEREFIIRRRGAPAAVSLPAPAAETNTGGAIAPKDAEAGPAAPASPSSSPPPPARPPILAVITHPAVIAIAVGHAAHNWLHYTVLTWMPAFLAARHGFDLKGAGAASALPYAACTVASLVAGVIADRAIARGVPKRTVRVAAQTVGELLPAALLVASAYASSPTAAVALLTGAVGFSGVATAAFGSNHLDVAPQFAGLLFGLANTLASLPGVIAPSLIGYLVRGSSPDSSHGSSGAPAAGSADDSDSAASGWQRAFWLSAAIAVAGWAVFAALARAEPITSFEQECLLWRWAATRRWLLPSSAASRSRLRSEAEGDGSGAIELTLSSHSAAPRHRIDNTTTSRASEERLTFNTEIPAGAEVVTPRLGLFARSTSSGSVSTAHTSAAAAPTAR